MEANQPTRGLSAGQRWPVPAGEKLERALVAGLLLEVVLEAPGLPDDPHSRRRLVKSRLTDSLVAHLAGRITLDRFRTLVHHLNQWFSFYYPLMPPLAPSPEERPTCVGQAGKPSLAAVQAPLLVRPDLLNEWFKQTGGGIFPRRPQRKFQPERLEEFLRRSQGRWFRVKDLAHYFDIDRKTAWEYLQKLQEAGLLVHNGGRSAAVRYRLADGFLKLELTALERRVAQTLTGLPRPLTEMLTEWLAATAGEPFWEDSWPARLAAGRREELIASLLNAAVLEVVCRSGRRELLRLQHQWLRG